MIQMAGHKPWSGIKTKMTPEMRFDAIANAESLVQEILTQKMNKDQSSLPEGVGHPAEIYSEDKVQVYVH